MCELYQLFAADWKSELDFSDQMKQELYESESFGGKVSFPNGYYHGKRMLNLTVSMWKEDLKAGYLFKCELYSDPKFPHSWLDKVLKNV